ncbi:MAG: hypothetical protein KDB14_32315 [Planctomycetales bacterium]|nr:hypothetical protein [Planctomycetales bacterium]
MAFSGTFPANANTVTMKSGFQIEGRVADVASVSNTGVQLTNKPDVSIKSIYVIDDGMRRVFVSERQVANNVPREDKLETLRIDFNKPPPIGQGRMVASVGTILNVTPFDDFGRRVFSIAGPQGRLDIIQGITEINSRYVKVEGLQSRNPYTWDMRIPTSSIDRDVLTKVMMRQIDGKDADQRLKLFRLYTEAERYRDASVELQRLIADFKEMKRLGIHMQTLSQLRSNRLVKEIERLKDSGQHQYVYQLLQNFKTEGVAAETLLKVRDMVSEYESGNKQRLRALALLDQHLGELKSAELKADVNPIITEIKDELNVHTLTRMASYLRLADDPGLTVQQKLSLAISAWLLGGDNAMENMAETAGLCKARPLVYEYLQSPHPHIRERAVQQLQGLEGVGPENLSAMLKLIKPENTLDGARKIKEGLYEVTLPGPQGEADITYFVQLPPEYTPHRKYPCIVTLHGGGTSPELQLDFWAGGWNQATGRRVGQAGRHGYIVIAPAWTKEHQRSYEFSFREHACTLFSLRDALHRLSIDTDRVFLSGHSIGGDAAWDIGLAHPDLWAGVIPIVASARKYVSRYWPNGKGLPLYFVTADMDAGRAAENAREWDRYLTRAGFDCTVVEYRGRCHESFQDEIQNLFRWMNVQERDFARSEFSVVTMRDWDNFFWFLEVDGLPAQSIVPPAVWPRAKVTEAPLEAEVFRASPQSERNTVALKRCKANNITVYLSPDWVDFNKPVQVTLRGRRLKVGDPDIGVILEDVRTRGDRLHPFWAKAE